MIDSQFVKKLREQYNPEGSTLRNFQKKLLDLMKDFDIFCRQNDIKYSIHAGTLLGAIRHGGFIPWDDDMDIAMTRDEFNKLLSFRKEDSSLSTTLILWTIRQVGMISNGNVFIDVMIVDNVPDCRIGKWIKKHCSILVFFFLKARNYYDKKWNTSFKLWMLLIPFVVCIPTKYFYNIFHWVAQWGNKKYTKSRGVYTDVLADIGTDFDRSIHDSYCDIDFEGVKLMCVKDYDALLRRYYGDYMQLPKHIMVHGRLNN